MLSLRFLAATFLLLTSVSSTPFLQSRKGGPDGGDSSGSSKSKLPLPTHLVHQFPNPTWIENVALRTTTGSLLLTLATLPELYSLDPNNPTSPVLLYTFPTVTSVLGITQMQEDVFYVAASNVTLPSTIAPHTSSIWQVDLRGSSTIVKKITDVPEAGFLNGIVTLTYPSSSDDSGSDDKSTNGTILMADSTIGHIAILDVVTGAHRIWLDAPETHVPAPPAFQLGVNGLKILNGYLYFTNTGQSIFCRVKLTSDGEPDGSIEVLASVFGDDFCFDSKGRAWVAQNSQNTVSVVEEHDGAWKVTVVDGAIGSLEVAGGTSCVFGQKKKDSRRDDGDSDSDETLYLMTTGALLAPVNGSIVEGGKVVAISTHDYNGSDDNDDDDDGKGKGKGEN